MANLEDQEKTASSLFVEIVKTLLIAIGIAFVLRTLLFQPFHIPSGSMEPTLYKGDYIITTKYSLGYGKYAATPLKLPIENGRIFERLPKRGDIIVFKPVGSDVHYIKRLVGLPGDEIQMMAGKLILNGVQQHTQKTTDETWTSEAGNTIRATKFKETLADSDGAHLVLDNVIGSEADNTELYIVPERHYFFLGDNRDNSRDSRVPLADGGVGFVPATNLVGRAEFVLLSVDEEFKLIHPWTWGNIRGDRLFKGLK